MEGGILLLLLLFHFSEWAGLSGSPLGNRGGEGDGGGARVIINGDYFCPHTFPGRISAGRRRRVPRAPVPSCSQPGGRGGRRWGGERGAPERIAASSAPRGPARRGGAGASREREAGQGVVQPGLSPVTPRPRSLSRTRGHPFAPHCPPLSFRSHTPAAAAFPRWGGGCLLGGRVLARVMAAARQRRGSTGERDGGAPAGRARGHGCRARGGQGRGRREGELRAAALLRRRLRAVPLPRPGRPRRPAGQWGTASPWPLAQPRGLPLLSPAAGPGG